MRVSNIRKTELLLAQALKVHQAGKFHEAAVLYERVLKVAPENAEALHLSGLVAHQQGNIDDAIKRIKHAIRVRPNSATFIGNLSAVLTASKRFEEAAQCHKRLVALNPENHGAWFGLGDIYQQCGQFEEAIKAYTKAIKIQPDHIGSYHNLGAAYHAQGEQKQALKCFQAVLKINPEFSQSHFSLGNVYRVMGALNDAVQSLQKAIQIKPDYIDALFNLANLHKDMGDYQAAVDNYIRLLKIAPSMAEAHNNLGNVFYGINQTEQALQCYQTALKICPDYVEALHNMSIVMQNNGQYEEAMAYCQKALLLKPDYGAAHASLVHQMRQACAWEDLKNLDQKLDQLTQKALSEEKRPAENPFLNISRHADPASNLLVAQAWSRDLSKKVKGIMATEERGAFAALKDKSKAGRLRIGYLSNNFRNHPTAHLLIRLFGLHDREQFEVYAYSYGANDASEYRKLIEQDCDRFVELNGIGDREAADHIRADKIDILVDLVGYMQGHRMGICARRPAPIQVRYLGMAGTSGADFFDYLIADSIVVPEEHTRFYSEKLVYMPHCYQINDDRQPIADSVYTKADFDLPLNAFIYCSFASHYKLDPIMFAAWMRILHRVQPSVLWLTPGSNIAKQNLKDLARAHGIAPGRLVFTDRMPKEEHLARLKLADLALDTRLVGGAATTSDALWSGIPVITMQGGHFASRMSMSLLSAMGLDELITENLDEYESMAIHLGGDHQELARLKQKLINQRDAGNLFNTLEGVRHLESAFTMMWNHLKKGQEARKISL